MGLLHSLLGAVGLASAGQVRTAQRRADDLKRSVADSRAEAARWKAKANELTAKLSVTGIRAMGAAAMVTSESEITDAAGDHVVTTTSVLLVGEGDA